MDPHHCALRGLRRRRLGEGPVHLPECRPVDGVVVILLLEGVQDRPERLLGGDVVEGRNLLGRQRQARDRVGTVAVRNLNHAVEVGVGGVFRMFPSDPGAVIDATEEALECRDDPVRALVLPELDLSVDLDFLVGLTVIDDDQIRRHFAPLAGSREDRARRSLRLCRPRRSRGPCRHGPGRRRVRAAHPRNPPTATAGSPSSSIDTSFIVSPATRTRDSSMPKYCAKRRTEGPLLTPRGSTSKYLSSETNVSSPSSATIECAEGSNAAGSMS